MMKSKTTGLLLALITVVLLFPQISNAQYYIEWENNLALNIYSGPLVDKNGNFYFVSYDSPYYNLNKINSDGTPGWQMTFPDMSSGPGPINLDQSGNIIITVDSIPFAPGGAGYDHLTSYMKYSPSGTLIANPSILEPLFAYFASWNCRAGIDYEDNVLITGITPEWLSCGQYTCGYEHLRLTFMNDAGVISRITVDQGDEWTLDGFCGDIIGPDVNNEFLVQYTNKNGAYPSITYKSFLLRCSASSGVIWKQEINPGESPILVFSGAIYKYSPNSITKYDQTYTMEWTYNNPSGLSTYFIRENPIDFSIVNFLAGGSQLNTLICLEQDGTIRWRRDSILAFNGFDRDGNLLAEAPGSVLYQISYIDGNIISSSPNIHTFGKLYTDTLGNIFFASRTRIGKLAPLPTMTIQDANQDAFSNTEFYLIRVADDAPLFTPDTLGVVKTDSNRKIELIPVP